MCYHKLVSAVFWNKCMVGQCRRCWCGISHSGTLLTGTDREIFATDESHNVSKDRQASHARDKAPHRMSNGRFRSKCWRMSRQKLEKTKYPDNIFINAGIVIDN